jgi:hypothetical protein
LVTDGITAIDVPSISRMYTKIIVATSGRYFIMYTIKTTLALNSGTTVRIRKTSSNEIIPSLQSTIIADRPTGKLTKFHTIFLADLDANEGLVCEVTKNLLYLFVSLGEANGSQISIVKIG